MGSATLISTVMFLSCFENVRVCLFLKKSISESLKKIKRFVLRNLSFRLPYAEKVVCIVHRGLLLYNIVLD